jgi:PPM family protein phosphatase
MPAQCQYPMDVTFWHAASLRGPRRVNADATATHHDPVTGRSAFVVADGVGDSERAASAAQLAARTAALVAVTEGPEQAVLAAQRALLDAAPGEDDGDCVLVVAVPGEFSCDVAWVGDCRAYHSNGRILEQITVDYTVAEYFRSRGQEVTPRMEHLVTTSIRTVRPDRIGTSRTGLANGRLLLCSDGVHKSLSTQDLRAVIAELLVDAAVSNGGRDNATALVIDHTTGHATPAVAA